MHFHFQRVGMVIRGWLSPDNPATEPHVEIVKPDGAAVKMKFNVVRPDVRDAGFHHTGGVGFHIDENVLPDLPSIINELEIREPDSGVVVYRSFKPEVHLPERVFRFEMQVMPYAAVEAAWSSNFALYYNALERYPFDTLRWILASPDAESVALSGRISMSRYEHFLKEHRFKFVALLKDPLEELAERLLFIRYAKSSPENKIFEQHLTGLEGLELVARRIDLASPNTISEAFSYLSDNHIHELSNPLVRTLACGLDEYPTRLHVEVALNRLAGMDLVGVRSNFQQFKSALAALLSRDIMPEYPKTTSSVADLTKMLREVKLARSLVKFDALLYQYVQEAVERAIKIEQMPPGLHAQHNEPSGASAG